MGNTRNKVLNLEQGPPWFCLSKPPESHPPEIREPLSKDLMAQIIAETGFSLSDGERAKLQDLQARYETVESFIYDHAPAKARDEWIARLAAAGDMIEKNNGVIPPAVTRESVEGEFLHKQETAKARARELAEQTLEVTKPILTRLITQCEELRDRYEKSEQSVMSKWFKKMLPIGTGKIVGGLINDQIKQLRWRNARTPGGNWTLSPRRQLESTGIEF